MKMNELMKVIEAYKGGTWISIEWQKSLKTRKGVEDTIVKKTSAVLRMGVTYDHKASVIKKRENGELPEVNQGLPYGTWHLFPYLIEYKGSYQLRVTTTDSTKYNTKYYLNGKEVTKDDIASMVLKSEITSSRDKPEVFNIKVENILNIG